MNNFIREQLSEEEIDWALMKLAHGKKMGFSEVSFRIEASRFTRGDIKMSEDPIVLKKIYAGVPKKD